ncbi:E3 ubiquitin-protein ligase SGR9, amyloplastic [Syzygium oleosum]|uniref:E3 ubiquitin-protein ligase SGR9, amyloplastic n=1 Tax=Syzygium oleosum TaxID=219896 RepID=UPI0011D19E74|nr:E3 ubiquitin-protein ligase SGR9, amyloplastic [Syzygium oleosum]
MEAAADEDRQATPSSAVMAALATLSPPQLSALTDSVLADLHHHHRRVSALLSSPSLFSLALRHLLSLPLPLKSLLIARHLLSSLRLLSRHLPLLPGLPSHAPPERRRDRDAATLLLLLCELRHRDPRALEDAAPSEWRSVLRQHCSKDLLSIAGIGAFSGGILAPYVEMVVRCRNFVEAVERCLDAGEGRRRVAASPAAVVALPSVEAAGGGECAVCREEMEGGRDVCELPCRHSFHWMCILPWVRKTNTCPCCRFELPTDDVFGEIRRLWDVLTKIGSGSHDARSTWSRDECRNACG